MARGSAKAAPAKATAKAKAKAGSSTAKAKTKRKSRAASDESDGGAASDAYEDASDEDADALDSDALDEDADVSPKKRKRASPTKKATRKKKKATYEDYDDTLELAEGQEVVGRVVQAPKTGHVPAGQISRNTLDFLSKLADPECNNREWFKLHNPVYRVAEREFKAFIESFTDVLSDVDGEIPPLPPKDVIHRIYRDMRFSNDKTPYKRGFSASFSRSGRKGKFAHYHVSIRPGQSLIAAGCWCPDRNELATIRAHLMRHPGRFRQLISAPEFVRLFGPAQPAEAAGEVQNVFGREDELKTAPKGVPKDHPDIDLLRLRSFAVAIRFTDAEVLDPGFKERLGEVATVMRPFVRRLNDMITLPPDDDEEEDGNTAEQPGNDESGEEEDEGEDEQ